MISKESCDSEDWSNDAENSNIFYLKYIYLILKYINIETIILKCNNISLFVI